MQEKIRRAAAAIAGAEYVVAFTGAGISVESGIPSFRGPDGLWSRYDPRMLEIGYFFAEPEAAWRAIREVFYQGYGITEPNAAHKTLAAWEQRGIVQELITMNIDDLHHRAGNADPIEYHGNCRNLVCTKTGARYPAEPAVLDTLPPRSPAGDLLKPDFVFFGEGIPPTAAQRAETAARRCDVMVVVGTTGEVYPAAQLPITAASTGAAIIEINVEPSRYTNGITDIFLQGEAGTILPELDESFV